MYRNNQQNHLSESWNSRWSSPNNVSLSPSSTEISLTSSSTPSPTIPGSRSSTSSLPTIRSPRYSPYSAMSSPQHAPAHAHNLGSQSLVLANGPSLLSEQSTHRHHGIDEQKFNLENSYPTRTRTKSENDDPLPADAAKGLLSARAFLFLILWYIFSALTLFLNKYILSTLKGDPTMLSTMQMVMTISLGLANMYFPCGMYTKVKRDGTKPPNFYRNMMLVGSLRFATVFLGLVALKYVAVSFTETVKSSAPIFTVLIAWGLTGERTGFFTQMSLIPIMSGLALCSAYELSYNIQGFLAALATNLSECMQNVYSKMLICGDKFKYTPAEMQFYTSVASIVVQVPTCLLMMDIPHVIQTTDAHLLMVYVMNGTFFHYQTITAYVLMGYISPVTHSVANTVKRAFLIWSSVLLFGNPVTFLSGLGTVIVTIGVLMYNKAREYDHHKMELEDKYKEAKVTNI